jgi:predicted phosphohydrolase
LKRDLAGVDRRRTPWLLALLHAPWYNTNEAHQDEGESMRAAMERLLYEARVDVVFAGHVHAYERFVSLTQSSGIHFFSTSALEVLLIDQLIIQDPTDQFCGW